MCVAACEPVRVDDGQAGGATVLPRPVSRTRDGHGADLGTGSLVITNLNGRPFYQCRPATSEDRNNLHGDNPVPALPGTGHLRPGSRAAKPSALRGRTDRLDTIGHDPGTLADQVVEELRRRAILA
jgi:hypothetical protein